MPNDPGPTEEGGLAAQQAPATVSGPPQRPIDVYAHIIQVLPEKESRFAQGADIPLIVRVVIGVASTAQTGFDFELSLTSGTRGCESCVRIE